MLTVKEVAMKYLNAPLNAEAWASVTDEIKVLYGDTDASTIPMEVAKGYSIAVSIMQLGGIMMAKVVFGSLDACIDSMTKDLEEYVAQKSQ